MKKHIMQDKNGNEQTFFYGLWWSRNFDRFLQLLAVRDGPPVLVCRLSPGSNPKFVRPEFPFRRLRWWNRWTQNEWAFLDPETQLVFPGEREVDSTAEGCYYEKESVS